MCWKLFVGPIENPVLLQDNLRLGKKLATGGFGTVFKADLTDDENPNDVRSAIVKKVSPGICSVCDMMSFCMAALRGHACAPVL